MAIIGWILTIIAAAVIAIFIVVNQAAIDVNLWPFPRAVALPVWVVAMAPLVVGCLLGLLVGVISGGTTRQRAREQRRQVQQLQRQLAAAQRAEPEPTTPAVPAALPPAMSETAKAAQFAGPVR
ncbi:MAG: hypothetical protein Kilf2KO_34720 [Rhodospirillales bacterium]